ncbi:MAG TPA: DUF4118 domain-containing protein, partial [Stellaceae bacterium]|nr:DUF4118 domain-containing protein [Stellaceae bacterium]
MAGLVSSMPALTSFRDTWSAAVRQASAGILSLLLRPSPPPVALGLAVAAFLIAAETLVLYPLKQVVPADLLLVVYLFGVMAIASVWRFWLTVAISVASVLAFDYFHTPPLYEITLDTAADRTAVVTFLAVGLLTGILAGVARSRAAAADRAAERAGSLAERQAALRRVATLIARGVSPAEVFAAVAEEVALCLHVEMAGVMRYEADGAATIVSGRFESESQKRTLMGSRWSLEGDNIPAMILRTGRAARMDTFDNAAGALAAGFRELGVRCAVAVPIVFNETVWGLAGVVSSKPGPLPADTEARLSDFADLIVTAIANAATRDELIASRARIVAAADDARRRFERDLHDGAQQRLVSMGLELRLAEGSVPPELQSLKEQLSRVEGEVTDVLTDLQEISRGIHPAILSQGGLGLALKTLARRCPVPVNLDFAVERRLPDAVEVAAYYLVAEALTNAAKYAKASEVKVRAETSGADL